MPIDDAFPDTQPSQAAQNIYGQSFPGLPDDNSALGHTVNPHLIAQRIMRKAGPKFRSSGESAPKPATEDLSQYGDLAPQEDLSALGTDEPPKKTEEKPKEESGDIKSAVRKAVEFLAPNIAAQHPIGQPATGEGIVEGAVKAPQRAMAGKEPLLSEESLTAQIPLAEQMVPFAGSGTVFPRVATRPAPGLPAIRSDVGARQPEGAILTPAERGLPSPETGAPPPEAGPPPSDIGPTGQPPAPEGGPPQAGGGGGRTFAEDRAAARLRDDAAEARAKSEEWAKNKPYQDDMLRQWGKTDEEIGNMTTEQRAIELQKAQRAGITPSEPPPSPQETPAQQAARVRGEQVRADEAVKNAAYQARMAERTATQTKVGTRESPVELKTADDVITASEKVDPAPTRAQTEAGNYQKGHVRWEDPQGGLIGNISIETPVGGIRKGIGPDGQPWQARLPVAYGYFKRTTSNEPGQQLDVFLGPRIEGNPTVYVLDQVDPVTGKFDEHKVLAGFTSPMDAVQAYVGSHTGEDARARIGGITPMDIPTFKDWVKTGDMSKRLSPEEGKAGRTGGAPPPTGLPVTEPAASAQSGSAPPPTPIPGEGQEPVTGRETHHAHAQVEDMLRSFGENPDQVAPAHVAEAAHYIVNKGMNPRDAWLAAVAKEAFDAGRVTRADVEKALGHEEAARILDTVPAPGHGLDVAASGPATRGTPVKTTEEKPAGGDQGVGRGSETRAEGGGGKATPTAEGRKLAAANAPGPGANATGENVSERAAARGEGTPRGTAAGKPATSGAKPAEGVSGKATGSTPAKPAETAAEAAVDVSHLPPVPKGKVRLYRGEFGGEKAALPEWVEQGRKNLGIENAEGRWFTHDPGIAQWYVNDAGPQGRLTYVDVPKDVAEAGRVDKNPAARQFSKDPKSEYFLPASFKGQAKPVGSPAETAAEAPIKTIHVGEKKPRGPRAKPKEQWSVAEFIASEGGIDVNDKNIGDVRSVLGTKNKLIPGFGPLIRKGGKKLDHMRESAVEAGYIDDPGFRGGGEATSTTRDLLNALDSDLRGQKVLRQGVTATEDTHAQEIAQEQNEQREKEIRQAHKRLIYVLAASKSSPQMYAPDDLDAAAANMVDYNLDSFDALTKVLAEREIEVGWMEPDEAGQLEPYYEAAKYENEDAQPEAKGTEVKAAEGDRGRAPPSGEGAAAERPKRAEATETKDAETSRTPSRPSASDRQPGPELGQAKLELETGKRGEPTVEPGAEGKPQLVLPGAERLSDAELNKRRVQQRAGERLKPKVAQKPADEGLFSDESKQTDLLDVLAKKPPTELAQDKPDLIRQRIRQIRYDRALAKKGGFDVEGEAYAPVRNELKRLADRLKESKSELAAPFVPRRPAPAAHYLGEFLADLGVPLGQQAQAYVLKHGRAQGIEFLVAFDANGNVVAHQSGDEWGTGRLPESLVKPLLDPTQSVVVHHNHPRDVDLSHIDISLLAAPGLQAIWAHGNGKLVSRAALTPEAKARLKGTDLGAAVKILHALAANTVGNIIFHPLVDLAAAGRIPQLRTQFIFAHLQNEALRRAGILDYRTNINYQDEIDKFGLEKLIDVAAREAKRRFFGAESQYANIPDRRAEPLRHVGDLGTSFGEGTKPAAEYVAERGHAPDRPARGQVQARGPPQKTEQLTLPGFFEGGSPPNEHLIAGLKAVGTEVVPLKRKVIERGPSGRPTKTEPIPIGTEEQILEKGIRKIRDTEADRALRHKLESQIAKVIDHMVGKAVRVEFPDEIVMGAVSNEAWKGIAPSGARNLASGIVIPADRLVKIAMGDPKYYDRVSSTILHEVTHVFEFLLASDQQRALLERETPRMRKALVESYQGLTAEQIATLPNFEVRALMGEGYMRARASSHPGSTLGLHVGVRAFFENVMGVLNRVGNLLRGLGYQNAEDIFDRLYKGEMAHQAEFLPAKQPMEFAAAMPVWVGPMAQRLTESDFVQYWKQGYANLVDPAIISDKSLMADAQFAHMKAATAQEIDALLHASESEWRYWNKIPEADQLRYVDTAEHGRPPPALTYKPDWYEPLVKPKAARMIFGTKAPLHRVSLSAATLQGMSNRHHSMMNEAFAQEQLWGSPAAYYSDYWAHQWKDVGKARIFFVNRATGSSGPNWFTKKRFYEDIKAGMAAGLELKTTNPTEMIANRLIAGVHFRQQMQLLDRLEKMELAYQTVLGSNRAEYLKRQGWAPINAPSRKEWLLHPDVQLLWKNGVEALGLWQDERWTGGVFRKWMAFKNVWMPIKLAASFFHPMHVGFISIADAWARGWSELIRYHAPAQALKSFLLSSAYNPLGAAIPYAPHTGKQARMAWEKKAADRTPEENKMVQLMVEGGFTPRLSQELRIAASRKLAETLQTLFRSGKKERGKEFIKAPVKLPILLLRRAVEKYFQGPIFDQWIPSVKAAAYIDAATSLLKHRPDLQYNSIDRKVALRAIAKSTDDRFGEMFYGAVFMNPTLKQSAQAGMISLGWNLGNWRGLMMAPWEAVSRPIGKIFPPSKPRQIIREATNKVPFFFAYGFLYVFTNAVMTMGFTGTVPHGADYFQARIGANADGTPRRVGSQFSFRDVFSFIKHYEEQAGSVFSAAWEVAYSKIVIQPLVELWQNRSYWGYDIVEQSAPTYKQVYQYAQYAWNDMFNPMSATQIQRAEDLSGTEHKYVPGTKFSIPHTPEGWLAFLGWGPAPKYTEYTAVENRIVYLYRRYAAPASKPFEPGETTAEKMRIRNAIIMAKQKGDDTALEKAKEDGRKLGFSSNYMNRLGQEPPMLFMFNKLPDAAQREILEAAKKISPEEYQKYFARAHSSLKRTLNREAAEAPPPAVTYTSPPPLRATPQPATRPPPVPNRPNPNFI